MKLLGNIFQNLHFYIGLEFSSLGLRAGSGFENRASGRLGLHFSGFGSGLLGNIFPNLHFYLGPEFLSLGLRDGSVFENRASGQANYVGSGRPVGLFSARVTSTVVISF